MAEKLSSAKVAEVLADAATALRKVAGDRDHWKKVATDLQRRDKAEKLASHMHDKGIDLDTPVETLADRLEKAAEQGKLDSIEQAVELVGPDMGTKIAQLSNDESRIGLGGSDLERFVVGEVG
jgi:hypothetical protein